MAKVTHLLLLCKLGDIVTVRFESSEYCTHINIVGINVI